MEGSKSPAELCWPLADPKATTAQRGDISEEDISRNCETDSVTAHAQVQPPVSSESLGQTVAHLHHDLADEMANPRAATGFNSARIGHLRAQLATQIHSIVLLDAELIIARAEFARCVVRHDGLMEVLRPQPLTAGLQQVHTTVVGNEHGSGVTAHINVAIASLQAGLDALQVDSGQYSSRKQAKHKPQREEAWLDTAVFTAFFTYVEVAESNEKDSNGHIKCSHCSQYVAQFGFGSCNHKVCYDCALTGGTFHGDGTCLVCEAHMPFIVFTDDCTKFYSIYTSEEDSRQDADLRIFSTAQGSLIAAMTLLRFACPENCPHELRLGWEDLRRHLLIEHDRYLCKHCASAKGLSVREQTMFTLQELRMHLHRPRQAASRARAA